jgi:hypothetical protein
MIVKRSGARPRISQEVVALQPIAAPSVLGLFGFATATMMVAAYQAGWYGDATSAGYLFPFAAVFGGLAQFLAGMWSYRARDTVATAMHGTWGSFWMAYGILNWLIIAHKLPALTPGGTNTALAFWFTMLAAVTLSGAAVALSESIGLFSVLGTLTVGSAFLAISLWTGSLGWQHAGGWVLVFSAGLAWYVATAMMFAVQTGRTILPLGKYSYAANIPGEELEAEWDSGISEPGVKHGQ